MLATRNKIAKKLWTLSLKNHSLITIGHRYQLSARPICNMTRSKFSLTLICQSRSMMPSNFKREKLQWKKSRLDHLKRLKRSRLKLRNNLSILSLTQMWLVHQQTMILKMDHKATESTMTSNERLLAHHL